MSNETVITITGNLVDDPELRLTPSGQPVAKFRIASTPRFYDKKAGEWKDGDTLFLTVNVWRQAAENVAESMTRGTRAIVQGRLRQRSYETKEGARSGPSTSWRRTRSASACGAPRRRSPRPTGRARATVASARARARPTRGPATEPAGTPTNRPSRRSQGRAPAPDSRGGRFRVVIGG